MENAKNKSRLSIKKKKTIYLKWPQDMIIFWLPINISYLAAGEFFSNFVWPPEGTAIKLLNVEILGWNFLWTLILRQKLALGISESIFCPKIRASYNKWVLQTFRLTFGNLNLIWEYFEEFSATWFTEPWLSTIWLFESIFVQSCT